MPKEIRRGNKSTKAPDSQKFWMALLEMFAELDTIYRHEDAFVDCRATAARGYRAWKNAAKLIDPEFEENRYKRSKYL